MLKPKVLFSNKAKKKGQSLVSGVLDLKAQHVPKAISDVSFSFWDYLGI